MSRFLFLESLRRWEVRLNPIPARAPVSIERKGSGGVFRSALPQGVQKTLTRVDHVEAALERADGLALQRMVQALAGIELSSIWPILIETLKDIALFYGGSVVTGAAVGGAVGSLGAGVGAIPGAAAGAAAGVTLGTWLLAIFGLKSLIEEVKDSIVAAFSAYKDGFSLAWKADPHPESMNHGLKSASHHVLPAASRFADGHVIVMTAILIGIVAWLTRGKGARADVLKDIENSPRLGPKVATWVKMNEAALTVHPGLKAKPAAAAGKAAAGKAAAAKKTAERLRRDTGPVKHNPSVLQPGSTEHKTDRWNQYRERGGGWNYERWSRQYEINMENVRRGLAREKLIRDQMGGISVTLKTPYTNRQIDIFLEESMTVIQVKTGPVSLTKENIEAIKKDAFLVNEGYIVEYILEKGASKPFLELLDKVGIGH